jgi:hypothetical protein
MYGDVMAEFELKQDWKFGTLLGFVYEFKNTENRRLPYHKEPPIYSAIKGGVEIDPGMTFKFSPYFMLDNLKDGVSCQFRYTYIRHLPDTWYDRRSNKNVVSYLESARDLNDAMSCCVRSSRKDLSEWSSHYFTLQLEYDSVEGMKNWWLKPKFYALFDYAMSGRNVSKTHQLTVGVQFHPW